MAYRFLDDLDVALSNAGIPFVEVPATPIDPTGAASWRTRGRPTSTGAFDPVGVLCHHTASPPGTSDRAELNVVVCGNGSAPGPIAQLLIGRENGGTVYLVAAGRANHGGKGKRPGIDSSCADMNAALVGIEVSNSGVGERWPDSQTTTYARVVAALCDHYGWSTDAVYLHATTGPPSGGCNSKIDPAGPWQRQADLVGSTTWNLDVWRTFVDEHRGAQPPPVPGGNDLVHTLIRISGAYAVFAGDSDNLGIVHTARWVGPSLNSQIGFMPDNVTPRIAGTKVLDRKQSEMATITLVGPVPTGDRVEWSAANFYQGG